MTETMPATTGDAGPPDARADAHARAHQHARAQAPASLRARVAAGVESERVQKWIIALVIVNAVTLGLETVPEVMARWGSALRLLDAALLGAFVVELGLKLWGQGARFFRNGWNVFDFVVVAIALVPADRVPEAEDAVLAAFQAAGFGEPGLFVVNAVEGASLL